MKDRLHTDKGKKIVVAVTGASGSIYARLLLERLAAHPQVSQTALIVSDNGRAVAEHEGQWPLFPDAASNIVCYDNRDLFAAPASGSARYDAMVVVPCSMGTVGRIAAGVSEGLIGRAADVMLKEGRRLVLVPRETPLGLIHLRNLTSLAEAGAVVLPAMPSFYSHPGSVGELCGTVVERIMARLGLDYDGYEWGNS